MNQQKFISASEAVKLIDDRDVVGISGFIGAGVAEEIHIELEKRHLETGSPIDLTLVYAAGIGDGNKAEKGLNHYAHNRLIKRIIGGHWGMAPRLAPLVNANAIEAYNLPQGIISQLIRAGSAKNPCVVSHIGLGTFVDPDFGGGKLNEATKEDLVSKATIEGQDFLVYKTPFMDAAIIKGTSADEDGNISIAKEPLSLNSLSMAMNAKNNGGKVIVQVEKMVKRHAISPKEVKIPGVLVDAIVVVQNQENHMQTFGTHYEERFVSNTVIPPAKQHIFPMSIRKVIARRCALLLDSSIRVINYGIGMPEGIANVLAEEGQKNRFMPSIEAGAFGGIPAGNLDFGCSYDPVAIIDEPYMFDFYDGGGLDAAFLGLAQCDRNGNVNVSKFGEKIPGCGGFINISQSAKKIIYCGTFTAGGLDVQIKDGEIIIVKEGRIKKFVRDVEQITFSGKVALENNQPVIYVTERAVFELTEDGLMLTEIANGIDLTKDILNQMDFIPKISENLRQMDSRIFSEQPMKLCYDQAGIIEAFN